MDAPLLERIHRLHVAIGRVVEHDLTNFPARAYSDHQGHGVLQDFSKGMSEVEISETIHSLIHNIASFHDHLKKWGAMNGVNSDDIHDFFKSSFDFCVVRDLWNNDKHGYPPKNDGWSGKSPQLVNAYAVGRLSSGSAANSSAKVTLGKGGTPIAKTSGSGSANVVLTGDVVDKDGKGLSDAHIFIEAALRICEEAKQRFVPS